MHQACIYENKGGCGSGGGCGGGVGMAWDARRMRKASARVVVRKGRLPRAMVDGIGKNDMLWEL